MGQTRPTTEADIHELAENLRDQDRLEIEAGAGVGIDPVVPIMFGFIEGDWCQTAVGGDGRLVAIFGIGAYLALGPGIGNPWLLSTPAILDFPKEFLRGSRRIISEMHELYPLLVTHVDKRNTVSDRWMRWLGFSMVREFPFGVQQLPHYEAVRLEI